MISSLSRISQSRQKPFAFPPKNINEKNASFLEQYFAFYSFIEGSHRTARRKCFVAGPAALRVIVDQH